MTIGGRNGSIGGGGGGGCPKKKQRVGSHSRLSSIVAVVDSSFAERTLNEVSHKPVGLRRASSHPRLSSSSANSAIVCGGFNDSDTADIVLRLYLDQSSSFDSDDSESISAADQDDVQIYLHSHVLRRSKYFAALLSDRWQNDSNDADSKSSCKIHRFNLAVPATPALFNHHITVLQLLYSNDFSTAIDSAPTALSLLPVALELLFEDCVKACVRFLEVVPWTEDEEKNVLSLVPFLRNEECEELLARLSPANTNASEEMLYELILSATHNHHRAYAKAFITKLLRDFLSKESVKRVLDRAFETSFKIVKEALEHYSSPDFRGDHNETEAIQRVNLHTAMTNGRHLLWLVERMIELRVADMAVKEWSEQASFTVDLQKAFRDDAWRNIVPGLPAIVLRCTCKLANAVTSGTILANRQIRAKLVKNWLPVLIVCRGNMTPMLSDNKTVHFELEETFLRIISTLPMSEAQELLQQCLSFSSRSVEDCPHLVEAFNTWFRRANWPPMGK